MVVETILVCACTVMVGCGESRVSVGKATGTVTMDGKPLANVTVVFHPKAGRPVAKGKTNDAGEFTMTTYEQDDGAPLGENDVTVYQEVKVDGNSPEDFAKIAAGSLPMRYAEVGKSGFTAKVEGNSSTFTFDLKSNTDLYVLP